MAVVVKRVAVVVDKVIAMDIVDEAITVVIDAVARNLTRVGPDVGGQIRVGVVDAGVDNTDDDIPRTGAHLPGFRRVNIGICCAAALTGVVQAVQVAIPGIVRGGCRSE